MDTPDLASDSIFVDVVGDGCKVLVGQFSLCRQGLSIPQIAGGAGLAGWNPPAWTLDNVNSGRF
jgi:hypothetical protein